MFLKNLALPPHLNPVSAHTEFSVLNVQSRKLCHLWSVKGLKVTVVNLERSSLSGRSLKITLKVLLIFQLILSVCRITSTVPLTSQLILSVCRITITVPLTSQLILSVQDYEYSPFNLPFNIVCAGLWVQQKTEQHC